MKKSILLVTAIFSIAVLFTSCKEIKKEEIKTESHEGHDHDSGEELVATFKCPMDCEKGKTYAEAGPCPVCKMDLKQQSSPEANSCTKCEPGKCECKSKTAVVAKGCGKCEPANCVDKSKVAECDPASCKEKSKTVANCDPTKCASKPRELAKVKKECGGSCEPGSCECKA